MTKIPQVQPLADRCIIAPPPEKESGYKEQMVGGIIIPENGASGKVLNAYFVTEVLAIGPDVKNIHVGQKVIAARPDIWQIESKTEGISEYFIRAGNIQAYLP